MTKTPEQMAEEFFENWQPEKPKYIRPKARQYALEKVTECFLAGYQAAVNSSNNSNGWISVKERLPEIGKHGYSEDVLLLSQVGRIEVSNIEKVKRVVKWRGIEPVIETENGTPIEDFTHWMPLPKPPEEK